MPDAAPITAQIHVLVDESGRWYAIGWSDAGKRALKSHLDDVATEDLGLFKKPLGKIVFRGAVEVELPRGESRDKSRETRAEGPQKAAKETKSQTEGYLDVICGTGDLNPQPSTLDELEPAIEIPPPPAPVIVPQPNDSRTDEQLRDHVYAHLMKVGQSTVHEIATGVDATEERVERLLDDAWFYRHPRTGFWSPNQHRRAVS